MKHGSEMQEIEGTADYSDCADERQGICRSLIRVNLCFIRGFLSLGCGRAALGFIRGFLPPASERYFAAGGACSTRWPSAREAALFKMTASFSPRPLAISQSPPTNRPSCRGVLAALPPISR